MSGKIEIGNKVIGKGEPVFVIAEIGSNFNTLDEALKSVDVAIDCGVDAIKFQTFRADTVAKRDIHFPSETAGGTDQYELFKKYELSVEWHREIFKYARQKGIIAFSTPGHQTDVALLEKIRVPLYKVGSDDCTNLPFLKYIAEIGKPMLVSTGMANLSEVVEAVETVLSTGNKQLVILHTVSNYPIKDIGQVNLKAIQTLRHVFNNEILVGYSDHTTSLTIPVAAVTLGACVYEKHFTIDKKLDAPDAFLSADPTEMKAIVESIRELERALGNGVKQPAASEKDMRQDTQKSIIARESIKRGERITPDKVIIKRPAHGIAPKYLDIVVGRKATVDIEEDEIITWDKV
ncbi:N-acetylneuraminate synthase family protein [Chloroflexota bacterium]